MSSGPALIKIDLNKSLGANYTSPPLYLSEHYALQIQAVWTGSPVGAFVLQTSLNYQPGGNGQGGGPAPVAGNWDTYPNSSISSSGFNSCTWDIPASGIRWIRVMYTSSSGSGTLTVLNAEVKM